MAQQQRLAFLRRRRELAAGVIGAALFAAPAHAATLEVTSLADAPADACDTDCTLRDAITAANASGDPSNTITFQAGLNGTIQLTQGQLPLNAVNGLTIAGPGRNVISVSGDGDGDQAPSAGDSRIFSISTGGAVAISGLTLTRGYDPSNADGGAITETSSGPLALSDVAITNSNSGGRGGAIYTLAPLTVSGSTLSGNVAASTGGAVYASAFKYAHPTVAISDTTITGNQVTGGNGGGIAALGGELKLDAVTLTGNTASGSGGGLFSDTDYGLTVTGSTVSGNTAPQGGGMLLESPSSGYGPTRITESTISGNHGDHGAGIQLTNLRGGGATIARSTISGNDGGASSWGGGILVGTNIGSPVRLVDSTVAGNSATAGGGISVGSEVDAPTITSSSDGSIDVDNSTVAGNAASAHGGGIYLSQYSGSDPSVKQSASAGLTSTIVAGNTAAGAGQDLDRADGSTTGGFDGAFSLVQAPGDAPLTQQSMLIGVDPQLGSLGDHGGPTATMLPAGTSPVIDQGRSPQSLKVDQRNAPRLVDTALPNPSGGGDGTDIGAVELAADQVVLPPPPPSATFAVTVRGRGISPGTPLLPASTTPLHCAVTVVSMSSCHISLRLIKPFKLSKKTTLAKGTLIAEGIASSASGATALDVKVKFTGDGRSLIKARPDGVDTLVKATAATGTTSVLRANGVVHPLPSQSVTLGLGTRHAKLAGTVNKRLDKLARLIPNAKTVTCTAYSDKRKTGDVTLTRKQAKAACARLVKDGVKGKVTSTGKGHAKPVAPNKTKHGRALNRRIVIKFTL
jgi:CSLREA domain-containing protein